MAAAPPATETRDPCLVLCVCSRLGVTCDSRGSEPEGFLPLDEGKEHSLEVSQASIQNIPLCRSFRLLRLRSPQPRRLASPVDELTVL